ncbi:MAG: hypothetical protein ACEQSA_02085 [Weeksellaceae bacterium]
MPEQPDPATSIKNNEKIVLSKVTDKLLQALASLKPKAPTDDYTKLTVSQTVSFLALVYEKVRNAIEYREDHLIRRAAIERILKRRLALNPQGKNEAENVLRELMWARYFPNGSLGEYDIDLIQKIIDKYLLIKKKLLTGRNNKNKQYLNDALTDLITAEIEETLNITESKQESDFTYFIYQILKDKVKLEGVEEKDKDTFLFVAIENAYRKSDRAYQRYHLFTLFYKPLSRMSEEELPDIITKLPAIAKKIDDLMTNTTVEKMIRFTRRQLPPFLILFSILRRNRTNAAAILADKRALWTQVDEICREKYANVKARLNNLAVRSLIYIFVTKMLFALILEVPVSQLIYNHVNYWAIGINSIVPPIFMLLIILTVSVPGEDNTKRIFFRILDIIDADPTFEKTVALISREVKYKRPVLVFGFSILYTLTFLVTLFLIYEVLSAFEFNILSQALFIFFISVVAFFAYRIKQLSNRYRLTLKETVYSPVVDFFFMPILSLGKIFSEGVSRINFFILIFDFIIEAPFKLIIEVIEEWISFVRLKKEEII